MVGELRAHRADELTTFISGWMEHAAYRVPYMCACVVHCVVPVRSGTVPFCAVYYCMNGYSLQCSVSVVPCNNMGMCCRQTFLA